MRYSIIMAGGSGTRLWPMSRGRQPKQLIPFIQGKSLIQIAAGRLDGLIDPTNQFICAGLSHKPGIQHALPDCGDANYLGEPEGRDTLNAVGLSAAVIAKQDADAVIGTFTADHIIEPVDQFQQIVSQGFDLAEQLDNVLVTFGISPTHPATGFGYLELAETVGDESLNARRVSAFKEKPEQALAEQYLAAGPEAYLWNSGMFVWKAATLLKAIEKFSPENYAGLMQIAEAWGTDAGPKVLAEIYPTLKKISVDFAVMEPAATDADFTVAAVPMPLQWLDVGSWPSYAETCQQDDQGNALAAKNVLMDTQHTLVASNDPEHLIATIGCEDMIIIHTDKATLVCPKERAQDIKKLYERVGKEIGEEML